MARMCAELHSMFKLTTSDTFCNQRSAMQDSTAADTEDAAYQRALAAGGQSRKLQQLTPEARANLDAAHGAAQANAASAGVIN